MQLIKDLSRVIEQSTGRNEGKADAWHYTKSSTIKITGRHVLPIWRVIKGDVALLQYSFENIVFHVLHMRCAAVIILFTQVLTRCSQNTLLLSVYFIPVDD